MSLCYGYWLLSVLISFVFMGKGRMDSDGGIRKVLRETIG